MAGSGWIKLHRQFLKWEWWEDHNTAILFVYCLLKANHAPKKWKGISVNRGQFITGRSAMAKETGLSEQSVRTSLNRLKSTSEVTIKSTNKYSLLTVCNWDTYQLDENESNQQINQQANQQLTSNQPATNQQLTTNKNEKNNKNEENAKKEGKHSRLPACPYLEIQEEWNRLHRTSGLPECQVMNDARKRKLLKAWKQDFFRKNWKLIFTNFHRDQWRRENPEHAGFDILFQKENLTIFLESKNQFNFPNSEQSKLKRKAIEHIKSSRKLGISLENIKSHITGELKELVIAECERMEKL